MSLTKVIVRPRYEVIKREKYYFTPNLFCYPVRKLIRNLDLFHSIIAPSNLCMQVDESSYHFLKKTFTHINIQLAANFIAFWGSTRSI